MNYITREGSMTIRQETPARLSNRLTLWWAICQVVRKHVIDNCDLLKMLVHTPQQLFCDFCKSMGRDECHCKNYELTVERTPTYQMEVETWPLDQGTGGTHGGY